jgi:DNA-directed RNA polymerase subunit N (RpoN/RPB10)
MTWIMRGTLYISCIILTFSLQKKKKKECACEDCLHEYCLLMIMMMMNRLALDQLGLNRYCCRRMLLTHVDLIEKLLRYSPTERGNLVNQVSR